jgi:UDP-N-acetylglucosamine 2-epimerase
MKILSVVGARPEFIQAMPVSRVLRENHQEILVHTGQHYDYRMSQTFFDDLEIPSPDFNLEVGSGLHGFQTARILACMETVLLDQKPDILIVRGDTNSTMASSLAACKLQIPVAHIEAGERSYNRQMPEEINRIVTDAIVDIHFCASKEAITHLASEGIVDTVYWVGDVMLDVMQYSRKLALRRSNILSRLNLLPKNYSLVTIHRPANTDDLQRLKQIVDTLNAISERVVFPVHPRTRKSLNQINAQFGCHVMAIEPVGYLDMVMLEENARLIATDSGGVQREAYFLSVPCLTLREETEWTATVESGWNRLVGVSPEKIISDWCNFSPPDDHPPIFGDGTAAQRIVQILENQLVDPKSRIEKKLEITPALIK